MPTEPEPPLDDPLRTEEFDVLVRILLPEVRRVNPHLSGVEALREAARCAEKRLGEVPLTWIRPRG